MQKLWEVEQKYHVRDADALQAELSRLGFALRQVEKHRDTYFRHPCRDFRATDEAFRLRRIDDTCCVTYKGPRGAAPVKVRPEIELGVQAAEYERWLAMLEHLGFEPLPTVCKQRCVFAPDDSSEYAGCVIAVDEVEQLGDFAEVERIVPSEEKLAAAQHEIARLGEQLGLRDVQPQSYLSQLLKKLGIE